MFRYILASLPFILATGAAALAGFPSSGKGNSIIVVLISGVALFCIAMAAIAEWSANRRTPRVNVK